MTIEIRFDYLKENIQEEIRNMLKEKGLDSPDERNWDVFPMVTFEIND